jgi:hypothetical protein
MAAVRVRILVRGPEVVVVRVSAAGSTVAAVRDACGVLGSPLDSELTRATEPREDVRAPAGATIASLWVRPYTVALAAQLERWSATGEWPCGVRMPLGGLDELSVVPSAAQAADVAARAPTAADDGAARAPAELIAARALAAADVAGRPAAELAGVAAAALGALGPWGVLALLGLRRTRLSLARAPPSVAEMRASFELAWAPPGALTVGARALSKHWHRAPDSARFWVADWVGSEAEKSARASAALERLLRDAVWANCHRLPVCAAARAADVFELRVPSGYGARWAADGASFRGFLEPQAWDAARWAGTASDAAAVPSA